MSEQIHITQAVWFDPVNELGLYTGTTDPVTLVMGRDSGITLTALGRPISPMAVPDWVGRWRDGANATITRDDDGAITSVNLTVSP